MDSILEHYYGRFSEKAENNRRKESDATDNFQKKQKITVGKRIRESKYSSWNLQGGLSEVLLEKWLNEIT